MNQCDYLVLTDSFKDKFLTPLLHRHLHFPTQTLLLYSQSTHTPYILPWGSFMFKAKALPLLHKTLLPLTLSSTSTSTSTSTSLLRMAFSTGPNPYFEPGDPFFSGLESLIQVFSTFSYGFYTFPSLICSITS